MKTLVSSTMVVIISLHGKIKYLALSASAVCRQWGSQCVFQACPPSCSWLSYTNMLAYRLVSTQSGPKGKWVLVATFKDCSSCFSRLSNILEHSLGAQPPTSGKVLWQEGVRWPVTLHPSVVRRQREGHTGAQYTFFFSSPVEPHSTDSTTHTQGKPSLFN